VQVHQKKNLVQQRNDRNLKLSSHLLDHVESGENFSNLVLYLAET